MHEEIKRVSRGPEGHRPIKRRACVLTAGKCLTSWHRQLLPKFIYQVLKQTGENILLFLYKRI